MTRHCGAGRLHRIRHQYELLFMKNRACRIEGDFASAEYRRPGRQSRSLFIRTMTVGPGITPDLLTLPPISIRTAASARGLCALRAITAGGELHPALRTLQPSIYGWDAFLPQSPPERILNASAQVLLPCGTAMIRQSSPTARISMIFSGVASAIRAKGRSSKGRALEPRNLAATNN